MRGSEEYLLRVLQRSSVTRYEPSLPQRNVSNGARLLVFRYLIPDDLCRSSDR